MLTTRKLTKQFGGITATDNVNLSVEANEVHAIIGPNGAGKTTLISQLSGELKPDTGEIYFKGKNITAHGAAQRAKNGLARSFQITSVFMPMTLLENVMLAVQARKGHSFRFWAKVADDAGIVDEALAVLRNVNLAEKANRVASEVSHGEHRQLEIAMALAMEPTMLLLDEPMAGIGREETGEMVQILKQVKSRKTILLVEHDMDAVFSLADRISVLVYGRVIATGAPDAIRNNPEVQRAYLGE